MIKHKGSVTPPQVGLVQVGPLINITLAPDEKVIQRLKEKGKEEPRIQVKMMVDTGATVTCVEDRFARHLGLVPIRYKEFSGVSGKPELYPIYKMHIGLNMSSGDGKQFTSWFETSVAGSPDTSSHSGCAGLLGRDFLAFFKFVYNGPDGTFEIIDELSPFAKAAKRRMSRAKAKQKSQKEKKRRKKARQEKGRKGGR